ncbi:MAG: phosphate-binding protein [Chlorobiaceae bacterium]|nr:phosphate-binding protein [Chlorobiaceae bacterium]
MDNRARNISIAIALAAGILVPVWMWMRTPSQGARFRSVVPSITATSGDASVAVDRSLMTVMELQLKSFSAHYPETRVSLSPEPSGRTVLRLLDREAGGAVVDGALIREEDSVVASLKRPVRREPIARNALIFIVNRANPLRSVSVGTLKEIFSGRLTDWQQLGGRTGHIVACIDGSDFRSRAVLSSILFGKTGHISATATRDVGELISRVAGDEQAAAIVTLPEYAAALRSGNGSRIKAMPVSRDAAAPPVEASPATVYSGDYPLVSIVYYLYDPFDPTATGFGAWLSKEGQKLFERGDMAPYRQTVRTIILK